MLDLTPPRPPFVYASNYPRENLLLGVVLFRDALGLPLIVEEVREDYIDSLLANPEGYEGIPNKDFSDTLAWLCSLEALELEESEKPYEDLRIKLGKSGHVKQFLRDLAKYYGA